MGANPEFLIKDDPLWQRLDAFNFDDPSSSLNFSMRLARENGWTQDFAHRVLTEYKRFVYLAIRSGHPVTPSDQVDQAWHLHMIYTRQYAEFCDSILQQRLDHGPTRGGKEEKAKYNNWYEKTITSYTAIFGIAPPREIWPPAEVRFSAVNYRRVNADDNWIVPKGSPLQLLKLLLNELKPGRKATPLLIVIAILLGVAGCSADSKVLLGLLLFAGAAAFIYRVFGGFTTPNNRRNDGSGSGGGGCGSGCGGDSGCGSGCGGGGCGGGCGGCGG